MRSVSLDTFPPPSLTSFSFSHFWGRGELIVRASITTTTDTHSRPQVMLLFVIIFFFFPLPSIACSRGIILITTICFPTLSLLIAINLCALHAHLLARSLLICMFIHSFITLFLVLSLSLSFFLFAFLTLISFSVYNSLLLLFPFVHTTCVLLSTS